MTKWQKALQKKKKTLLIIKYVITMSTQATLHFTYGSKEVKNILECHELSLISRIVQIC